MITLKQERRYARLWIESVKSFCPERFKATYFSICIEHRLDLLKQLKRKFPRGTDAYINKELDNRMKDFMPWNYYIPQPEVAVIHVICMYYDELIKHRENMRADPCWDLTEYATEWKRNVKGLCEMAKFIMDKQCSPWLEMCPEVKSGYRHGKRVFVKEAGLTISQRFKHLPPAIKEKIDSYEDTNYPWNREAPQLVANA